MRPQVSRIMLQVEPGRRRLDNKSTRARSRSPGAPPEEAPTLAVVVALLDAARSDARLGRIVAIVTRYAQGGAGAARE
jgi:hypothetical protein